MQLDDDDSELFTVPATKKRKRESQDTPPPAAAAAPAAAILSAYELKCVIDDDIKARIVSAFSVLGKVDRFESSGAGYILRVNRLVSAGVREDAIQRAIQNSGVWVVQVLVRTMAAHTQGPEIQVTFNLKQGARGSSVAHRQMCVFGQDALQGVGVSTQSDKHRLLAEALVPAKEDRAMIARVISNWENYRAQDTPADVHWQLQCLDGTVIDSKTGESKKYVSASTTTTTGAGAGAAATAAVESKHYKLRIFGIHDATLAEMSAMSQPFMFHCSSAKIDPKLGCFTHEIATYVSGGVQVAFVKPAVTRVAV